MKSFNLSDWAIAHRSLVWYFMIIWPAIGAMSYVNLGREEIPNFSIKTMLVVTQWPGATASEMATQVTERWKKRPSRNWNPSTTPAARRKPAVHWSMST